MPDGILMVHLCDGHPDALAVLLDCYHRLVFNVALRILWCTGEAEDLVKCVFESAAQFDPARGSTKVRLLQYVYHRGFNRRQYLNLRGICINWNDPVDAPKKLTPPGDRNLATLDSARAAQLRFPSRLRRTRSLETVLTRYTLDSKHACLTWKFSRIVSILTRMAFWRTTGVDREVRTG